MCNFLEYKGLHPSHLSIYPTEKRGRGWVVNHSRFTDSKVVYRRYASLFFIAGIDSGDNELITLEIVHRYVEQMDKYYGNVCELDIIFNFQKAYFILDELLIAGELQESSKKNVLRCISQEDALEDMEVSPKLPSPSQTPTLSLSPSLGAPYISARSLFLMSFIASEIVVVNQTSSSMIYFSARAYVDGLFSFLIFL